MVKILYVGVCLRVYLPNIKTNYDNFFFYSIHKRDNEYNNLYSTHIQVILIHLYFVIASWSIPGQWVQSRNKQKYLYGMAGHCRAPHPYSHLFLPGAINLHVFGRVVENHFDMGRRHISQQRLCRITL